MQENAFEHVFYFKYNHTICSQDMADYIFDLETLMVTAKVKIDGYIWGLVFNRHACFYFCGNMTIFPGNVANQIFDLARVNIDASRLPHEA